MKALKTIICLMLIVLLITTLVGCKDDSNDYKEEDIELYSSWFDLNLPEDAVLKYHKRYVCWCAEGTRYSVFEFETEPTELLSEFKQKTEESYKTLYDNNGLNVVFEGKGVNGLNISKKYRPDWDKEYLWNKLDRYLTLIYYPDTLSLIVCLIT